METQRRTNAEIKSQRACSLSLAQMFGYSTTLRSLTQGRPTYSLEFKHYAQAMREVAERVIAQRK